MRLLLDIYREQRDYGPYCHACRRLLEKEPDNLALHLMLAGGYLNDARLASALRSLRRFVELWPDDPLADGARDSIEQLEPAVDELLRQIHLSGDDRLELAAMHEEVLACVNVGDCERTIRIGEQLLARVADFVPVMNNLSEAYFRTGQTDKAIAMSRQVLRQQPDDFHALANLTRHLFLSGRGDEANEFAAKLRSVHSERGDVWCKKCEALSLLGDDQAVLALFADAERAGSTKHQTPANSLLHHLAAVASARKGEHQQANRYWRKALKIQPNLVLATENLADAAQPVGLRHGPWCFSLNHWIRPESIAKLRDALKRPAHLKSDENATRATSRFAEAHPEIVGLVPALLERGDPAGREFAWRFAMLLDTPEMLEVLRNFCLSQRGPDAMRLETANRLHRAGLMPPSGVRLWLDGDWQQIELFGFEITSEPIGAAHGPQVDEWAYDGLQALRRGDGAEAERLFRKCIDREGELPDLLNNLAAAYALQRRSDESLGLIRRIHERWPDYFFGRIAMANMATQSGDYEQAEGYLAPLCRQKLLHSTEFDALATASVQLLLARRNLDGARKWLKMWRQVDPDHPDLHAFELRCRSGNTLKSLARLLLGRL